jgi:hypothetical protein
VTHLELASRAAPARIVASELRRGLGEEGRNTSQVVRIGILGRGEDKQPAIVRQTGSDARYVPACGSRTFVLPTPSVPWRVEVAIPTFVPAKVDPKGSAGERRALGARVSFDVVPS